MYRVCVSGCSVCQYRFVGVRISINMSPQVSLQVGTKLDGGRKEGEANGEQFPAPANTFTKGREEK